MTANRSLAILAFLVFPFLLHAQEAQMIGCLSQDASGVFRFVATPSGRTYNLQAGAAALQRHINQELAITGRANSNAPSPSFNVVQLRVISESCTSVVPSNERFAIAGKVGQTQAAIPVTSTASAGETTPGFQTEAGLMQAEGGTASQHSGTEPNPKTPFGPSNPEQAGQSEFAADINAQAASRAELYPGTTLGVDLKTAPPSSKQASRKLEDQNPQ